MNKKIILASASPRRKELLKSMGLEFEVIPSEIEENIENESFSPKLIENLAAEKAADVAKRTNFTAIVIGSDTVVVINNKILGKPKDKKDAFIMLKMLSGNTHQVISAIAVIDTETRKILKDSVVSDVTFKQLSDEEINAYIETGEPMDKAGAYAIQGFAGMFVKSINGCYSNIVGISVFKLAEMLKEFGVKLL
ncbi:MAG: septum formation protein Maf [Candidatus Melainabacteria bacterium GWA2_34_9]|nr:MAG: septum formation protein Maf [Candidatus Melainabacteria bacterium GWA2_34_9]